jgi:hypothetical protein
MSRPGSAIQERKLRLEGRAAAVCPSSRAAERAEAHTADHHRLPKPTCPFMPGRASYRFSNSVSASLKSSIVGAPSKRAPLMKKLGVPFTPLRMPPLKSFLMRSR